LGAPVHHQLRPLDGTFSRAPAATDKADDFAGSDFREGHFARGGDFEIRVARAHVFRLLTSDDPDFHFRSPLF
jgi:hypothetical protein